MSVVSKAVFESEVENAEFFSFLEDSFETLTSKRAPLESKCEAAIQCWRLSEHENKSVENRRQALVCEYGKFPHVSGVLVDLISASDTPEVLVWRCLRTLVQLSYDNSRVAETIIGNWKSEARSMAKDEETVINQLKEEAISADATKSNELKARVQVMKENLTILNSRKSLPSILAGLLSEKRISWRVRECIFHVLNNTANSSWDVHDIILKDNILDKAKHLISHEDTPHFVVSAAVGFVCSLSYRPASRPLLFQDGVVETLSPIVLKDKIELNSMSAVLAVANIAGGLPIQEFPIVVKCISALKAVLNRKHAQLLELGCPSLFVKVLKQKVVYSKTAAATSLAVQQKQLCGLLGFLHNMLDVMISVQSPHDKIASFLRVELESRGLRVITTFQDGACNLARGVCRAKAVLCLISAQVEASPHLRAEVLVALELGKKLVWIYMDETRDYESSSVFTAWLPVVPAVAKLPSEDDPDFVTMEQLVYDTSSDSIQPREVTSLAQTCHGD
ncbi:hypothetical protein GUITHDRAFT_132073 [Guillardia theta CCMP2712]|uniref:TIR domain-containing protein n=1 Tax=Guillardia theta (strain CCMP2712) TaxID=905079 RepID=L1K163_GUITC|nr:hypothetical protein GUITHDRAFT_132073 [Guillardia theta CCMP2712]EKX54322.1 hypothetical protein GUITHDRAFT_132073 [Guillardia theta CCMP2712]|eukprot:XP_005841302.1 hypothetical protein GUITHDRAFT_132073 [Guillardia theta CCMP2712]